MRTARTDEDGEDSEDDVGDETGIERRTSVVSLISGRGKFLFDDVFVLRY